MRILYCITRSDWGGAQDHLFNLVKDQVRRRNEITVVVGQTGPLSERLATISGVNLFIMPTLVRNIDPKKDLKTIFALRRLIKKYQPDILHLHSSKAGAVGRMAAIGMPVKVVFTAHGWAFTDGVSNLKKHLYARIERFLGRFTDVIFCVSRFDYNLALGKRIVKKINWKLSITEAQTRVLKSHQMIAQCFKTATDIFN